MKRLSWLLALALLATSVAVAQRRRGGGGGGGGESYVPEDARTAREVETHSTGTPNWTNQPGFEKDVFTFVRIKRDRKYEGSGRTWRTDTPDSDLNLSFRLQQMTSMKVDPDGRFLRLTEKDLTKYPFIYMVEPGTLHLDDEEVEALRKHLLNGGFLWLDDFWGEYEWRGMADELKKVFPTRKFVDLELTHPIYHCLFEIKGKHQVPSIRWFERGMTSERGRDSGEVHHRVIYDDKGRIMVLATHNTDNGDGWEREGERTDYFEQHSERTAYPLAINVMYYVMTH